ncbi:spore germination protein KB [Paenibacillus phyllosphaerae]|uniref:Spore germination protein KB n=1 Tax=Paenibacillus phyllosphaerae TaxID=274593 RepID=A0A7W5AW14_9BACL|nr:GerAB/ArcD/ProY family transporter [Paenibacillus phyllosphaerae]MBB3109820.1 spore germination protein KB [Paenibacillus phyllosphaerae]
MRGYMTSNQAAWLLFVFLTSSSIINIPAPLISYAGNIAWLSLPIAATFGLALLLLLLKLARQYAGKNLIEYSQATIGFTATMVLGLAFLYYQVHMASTIVLDVAMFMRSSMMRNTPSYWFIFLLLTVAAITVRAGIDKFAGMFPVIMVSVVGFTSLIVLMSINNYDVGNLLPLMPDGVKPLLHGVYFTMGVPYIELTLFGMLLPFIGNPDGKLGRKMTLSLICNMLVLMLVTIVSLLVFGPIAGDRKYSMFEVARTVEVADVFQRIEALMGYAVIAAAFMKTTIVLFSAHQTLIHLLVRKEDKMLIYPLAALMAIVSYSSLRDGEAHWIQLITSVHPLWGLTSAAAPLLLVGLIAWLRGKKKPPSADQQGG